MLVDTKQHCCLHLSALDSTRCLLSLEYNERLVKPLNYCTVTYVSIILKGLQYLVPIFITVWIFHLWLFFSIDLHLLTFYHFKSSVLDRCCSTRTALPSVVFFVFVSLWKTLWKNGFLSEDGVQIWINTCITEN